MNFPSRFLLTAINILVILGVCGLSWAQTLTWESNYSGAVQASKKTGKPIIVFFHADWCTYSQQMKATTLKDQRVISVLKNAICVSLNAEKEGKAVKEKLGARMYPAFVFVEPNGTKFSELNGFQTALMFRDEIQKRISAIKVKDQLLAAGKQKPQDGEVNARLAWLYAIQENEKLAIKHLEIAKASKTKCAAMAPAINMVGDIFQLSEKFEKAVLFFKDSLNYPGTIGDKSYSLVSIFSCYWQKGDTKMAREFGTKLINLKGATPEYVDFVRQRMRQATAGS